MSGPSAGAPPITIIRTRNHLRAKVGGREGIAGRIAPAVIAKMDEAAQATAANLDGEFLGQVHALRNACHGKDEDWPRPAYLGAHDVRGLAGTFGYQLLGSIAHDFCLYIEALPRTAAPAPGIVSAYGDALVSAARERGEPSAIGRELQQELRRLAIADIDVRVRTLKGGAL